MSLVAKRYAEALIRLAADENEIDSYLEEFKKVNELFEKNIDFRNSMINTKIKNDVKKEIIKKVFTGEIRKELMNFLMILVDNRRINLLPDIFKRFLKCADLKRDILYIKIISSDPLEEEMVEKIKTKYKNMYAAYLVNANVIIDKSLLGGIKVQIGDKVFDASLKRRLEELKEMMMET